MEMQVTIKTKSNMRQNRLNKELYTKLRNPFSLMAQFVITRYKVAKTQLVCKPYKYQDKNIGEWYREVRDLTWLHKMISLD